METTTARVVSPRRSHVRHLRRTARRRTLQAGSRAFPLCRRVGRSPQMRPAHGHWRAPPRTRTHHALIGRWRRWVSHGIQIGSHHLRSGSTGWGRTVVVDDDGGVRGLVPTMRDVEGHRVAGAATLGRARWQLGHSKIALVLIAADVDEAGPLHEDVPAARGLKRARATRRPAQRHRTEDGRGGLCQWSDAESGLVRWCRCSTAAPLRLNESSALIRQPPDTVRVLSLVTFVANA